MAPRRTWMATISALLQMVKQIETRGPCDNPNGNRNGISRLRVLAKKSYIKALSMVLQSFTQWPFHSVLQATATLSGHFTHFSIRFLSNFDFYGTSDGFIQSVTVTSFERTLGHFIQWSIRMKHRSWNFLDTFPFRIVWDIYLIAILLNDMAGTPVVN